MCEKTCRASSRFRQGIGILLVWAIALLFAGNLRGEVEIDDIGYNLLWGVENFKYDKNLLQVGIFNLVQDKDKLLWLGARDGLICFDGNHFFQAGPSISSSAKSLFKDRQGRLWIGTTNEGVIVWKKKEIARYSVKNGLVGNDVTGFAEDCHGVMWIGTRNGLFAVDSLGRIRHFTTEHGLVNNSISVLMADHTGEIWIGAGAIVHRLKHDTITVVADPTASPFDKILSILEDRTHRIWLGTSGGLKCLENGQIHTYTTHEGLVNNKVYSLGEGPDGSIWITTEGGVSVFVNGRFVTMRHELIAGRIISKILTTEDGTIWLNSLDSGLLKVKMNPIGFISNWFGLKSKMVWSIHEDRDGAIWIAGDSGLQRIFRKKFDLFLFNDQLEKSSVFCSFTDRRGMLWIGTNNGLFQYVQGRLREVIVPGIGQGKYWLSIYEDSRGTVWLGGDGVVMCYRDGQFYPIKIGDKSEMFCIYSFYEDHRGIVWVGSQAGLKFIQNGQLLPYSKEVFQGRAVYSIMEDGNGILWVGSDIGLIGVDGGRIICPKDRDGRLMDVIYSTIIDRFGNFWINGRNGISCISSSQVGHMSTKYNNRLELRLFNELDGILSPIGNGGVQPCSLKSRDGRLWFPTIRGVVVIDPEALSKQVEYVQPSIIKVSADGAVIRSIIHDTDKACVVPPGRDRFEFHFSDLNYNIAGKLLFRYKLEGFDRDWVDAGTNRVAYYTNLPPGHYRFRLQAAISGRPAAWNETVLPIHFRPLFRQTIWFYLLIALVILSASVLLWRYRVHQLEMRSQKLERMVDERTAELEEEVRRRTLSEQEKERLIEELQEALGNIKKLKGLLPICSNCKQIRDSGGHWHQLEEYIARNSEAEFSHSLCPHCAAQLYPDLYNRRQRQK